MFLGDQKTLHSLLRHHNIAGLSTRLTGDTRTNVEVISSMHSHLDEVFVSAGMMSPPNLLANNKAAS